MDEVLTVSVFVVAFMLVFVAASSLVNGRLFLLRRTAATVVLFICFAGIIYETLMLRHQYSEMQYKLSLFWSYKLALSGRSFYTKEIILNILLYIPFGFMLPAVAVKAKSWQLILVMLGMSISIELIQLVSRLGLFEFDDVFNNTIGGIVGLVCFHFFGRRREEL